MDAARSDVGWIPDRAFGASGMTVRLSLRRLDLAERAQPRTIRLLVQELLHAVLLADFFVIARERVLLGLEVIARLLVVHVTNGLDRRLGVAHDVAVDLQQLLGELGGLFTQ